MRGRYSLVAEDVPDFVDLVEPADNQPFEVKLQGDTQVKVAVERIMIGNKRPCQSSAGSLMQYRRLDLDKALFIEEPADSADNAAPCLEHVFDLAIGDEVDIPLAVPYLDITEPVPLFRQGPERL